MTEQTVMTLEEKLVELDKINKWLAKGKATADALRWEIQREAVRLQLIHNKEGAASTEYAVNGVEGKLTVTRKINRTIDQKAVPELLKVLPKELLKPKYELVISAYRKLDEKQLGMLSLGLKESEGLPTVEWVAKEI